LILCFLASRGIHTIRWIKAFADMGHEVHLITFDRPYPIDDIIIHGLEYRFKFAYLLRTFDIRRMIEKINPDILHAMYISHYGIYAAFSGFHPVIMSVLGSDILISPERSFIYRTSLQIALNKADIVHIADEVGKKTLIELGCNPEIIFVQEWGVDVEKFSPEAKNQSFKKELGINSCYSVLCASSWKINYNVDVLVRAIPLVTKTIPNVRFIFLGGGELENYLKSLANKLDVSKNTIFIGKVPYDKMPMFLASVDVFVDTVSDYAYFFGRIIKRKGGMGIGQTTREAMACGTPQILPDHSSINHSIFRGLTYRQLDHTDLAEKIVYLLQNQELKKKISEESRQVIVEVCNQKRVAKRWHNIYKKMMQRKH